MDCELGRVGSVDREGTGLVEERLGRGGRLVPDTL